MQHDARSTDVMFYVMITGRQTHGQKVVPKSVLMSAYVRHRMKANNAWSVQTSYEADLCQPAQRSMNGRPHFLPRDHRRINNRLPQISKNRIGFSNEGARDGRIISCGL